MRRIVIAILVASIASLAVIASGCISRTTITEEGFENDMNGWMVGKDLPLNPEIHLPVEGWATVNHSHARSGSASLQIGIDGRLDDGTVWIQKSFAVERTGNREYRVRFYLWSETESWNVIAYPVVHIGRTAPMGEMDFTKLQNANYAEGWLIFEYKSTLDLQKDERLWVALGITVAWETFMLYWIDDVRVTVG